MHQYQAILAIYHLAQAAELSELNEAARAYILNEIVTLAAQLLEGAQA